MQAWGRLITAMATPFYEDGKLNLEGAQKLAQKLAQEGTTALVVAGTTGESPTLSDEEKLELFAAVKEAVNIPIIAGIGSNNTAKSVKLAEKAYQLGVEGLMAVTPYYNKPNKQGLLAHYRAIGEAGQLPLMVYNVPGRTGINLDADIILQLAQIPEVVALKEATGDLDKISFVLRQAPAKFSIYTGEDALTLPVLALGCYGVVSVAAHVAGKVMKAMIEKYVAGEVAEASRLHLALTPIYKSLFVTANPIPLKAALKIKGFDAGPLRLPLVAAEPQVVALLEKDLKELAVVEETIA